MKNKKRGISPVIATILLISIVIAMGLIVFLWFRDFLGDAITKNNQNVEVVCEDVEFKVQYISGTLQIQNDGNIPIYRIKIKKISSSGEFEEIDITTDDGWPTNGLNNGGIATINHNANGYKEMVVIPILLGQTSEAKKTFECRESNGEKIILE